MKRMLIGLACVAALLCVALTASAEPAITRNGYTAYLGENNHLYLQDPTGKTQVLEKPIADVVELSDTLLYCISQEGQLISISLDGTQSSYLTNTMPTQEQLDEIMSAPLFTLDGTTLTVANGSTVDTALSTTAIAACTNGETLFWMESGIAGATTLKFLQLNVPGAAAQVIGDGVTSPLSMIATDDTLTMVAADHTVTVVTLLDRNRQTYPATSQLTTHAVSVGGQLIRYDKDVTTGQYTTEANIQTLSLLTPATTAPTYVASSVATNAPTTKPQATTTVRPTTTTKPSTSSSSSSSSDTLRKGDKGSDVRKMQKRLAELGYPVGVVDGVWGDDTQLAVNLFQCAIGYTERDYATSSMLNKLYSKKAPVYDPYAPLKKGDKGTDVLIMQTTLAIMGYNPGKLDGVYGANTVEAVKAFQKVAGLKVTGEADAATLKVLYSLDCPLNPDVYPTATPTPAPTDKPTDKPTTAPTDKPTNTPTTEPTKTKITKVTIVDSDTKKPLTKEPKPGDELTVLVEPEGATFTCEWHYENETEVIGRDVTFTVRTKDLGKKIVCTVTGTGNYTGEITTKDAVEATSTNLQ